MSEKSRNARPYAYPFIFLELGQAVETLQAPEADRGNFGISHPTVQLWERDGLLLSVHLTHPGSQYLRRRFAAGYIRDLSAFLETDPPQEPRVTWKKEVRDFSRQSAESVRLTKQLYDEKPMQRKPTRTNPMSI